MTLEEIVVKDNSAITADEREFLTDNKDKLTADQKVKFGFEQAPTQPETFSAEDRKILADIKSGALVTMSAKEKSDLESKVDASVEGLKKINREKIEADITKIGVETGRIKADQLPKWADLVEADESNLDLLKAIPENKIIADANTDQGGEAEDDEERLDAATRKIMAEAREKGQSIKYSDAYHQAEAELKTKENK